MNKNNCDIEVSISAEEIQAKLDKKQYDKIDKKELKKEFGFCLWDKAMNSRLMDAEQLYEFYLIERMKGQNLLIK